MNKNIVFSLFILTKNNFIVAAFSYALTITLTNILGPKIFGIYSLVLLIASILLILINYGTDESASIEAVKNGIKKTLTDTIFTRVVMLILCIIGLSFFALHSPKIALYIICIIFTGLNLSFFFEISKKNEYYSYLFLFERIIYLGSVFYVIYFFEVSLDIVFTLFLLSNLISLLFQYLKMHVEYRQFLVINWTSLIKIFSKNMPLVVIALSVFSFGGFSRLILEDSMGLEKLGIYSAGWQLITIGTIFQSQITKVWRLKISHAIKKNEQIQLNHLVKSYLIFATLPFLVFSIVLFFSSEHIVKLLFTEDYIELVKVLPVLSFYYLVINIAGLTEIFWIAIGKNKIYMYINVAFGLFLIIFLTIISKEATLRDFAISTVIIHMGMVVALLVLWVKVFKRKIILKERH
jgi:O-antigen/teichoic acid export membrane protein